MNFLADESVDLPIVERLREDGHAEIWQLCAFLECEKWRQPMTSLVLC
jgi:hypothetical protein